MMEKLLQLYRTLLETYTEQVKSLEHRKMKVKKEFDVGWIPYRVLNSRMFTYDEYLTNDYNGGFCYEEKNRVIPHFVSFIAEYEKSSEDVKRDFENSKFKNEYHKYLDELYLGRDSFIKFLESQLAELRQIEDRCKIPYPPQRRNATRQLSKYREDKEKYEEKIESINRCRNEVNVRIQLFKDLFKN